MVERVTISRLCFPGENSVASVRRHTLEGELDILRGDLLFTRLLHDHGEPEARPIPWRCDHLRQWYAVFPYECSGLGAGYYIDLQTPLVKTGASYECYDLVLDLFVDRQERYHILREEEFALAKACGWLHHRMAEKTWLQVADWVTLIKSGGFSRWLVELRRTAIKK
ncbi:MAG: DUF402 domain-containing protein [Bacillota bacterium]